MRFALTLGLALALTPAFRAAGLSLGVVDRPSTDGLKIHRAPVSLLGGPAALLAAGSVLAATDAAPTVWITAGIVLALLVGLVDDVRPLPAAPRLVALLGAGVCIAAGIPGLDLPGRIVVVVVTAATANAVNLVDGQDGLAGGLVAISALAFGAAFLVWDLSSSSAAFALAGGLTGFVVWNMSPRRIFLGNGGAYAAGAALAALSGIALREQGALGLAVAWLCVWPLAFELVFTVLRRAASGAMTRGDRLHLYDLLAARGMDRRAVTVIGWAVTAACASLGVAAAATGVGVGAALVALLAGASSVTARRLWAGRPHAELSAGDGG